MGGGAPSLLLQVHHLKEQKWRPWDSGISPCSGSPKDRNVTGQVLLSSSLYLKTSPSMVLGRVGPPSPTAPQAKIEIEVPWARRGHWLGSDSSSRPSQNRMGPSVNRIRLVNSWAAGLHLGGGTPATSPAGQLQPSRALCREKGGEKSWVNKKGWPVFWFLTCYFSRTVAVLTTGQGWPGSDELGWTEPG